jgi:hypothetical protein
VQQNASLVEEATAATESMKEQAASLLQSVSRFKLGADDAAFAALREAAPPPARPVVEPQPPIRVRPPARLGADPLPAKLSAPPAHSSGNGEWKEF